MKERNCLILTQYRKDSEYNDFVGKYYHFPATKNKNYLKQFQSLPVEIVYFEPEKNGSGVFYGYGKIEKEPFLDKREPDHYFVEISDYKPFSKPVYFKNEKGTILESILNKDNYNSNNAVRKINPSFLEDLCLDGGIFLNFKADAHLIQVLGEQLISSERVGILELVKNSFDAGASVCKVKIENLPDISDSEEFSEFNHLKGPVIIVEDNGKGMDREIIENGWLRPASRIKTNVKEEIRKQKDQALAKGNLGVFNSWLRAYKKSNKGRLPLGEKGVGRFATHRLGRSLTLVTKTKDIDYEYVLQINWDDFDKREDKPVNLDSVGIVLTKRPPSFNYGPGKSGTKLIIYGGREGFSIDKHNIQEIYDSLQTLNSPFTNPFTQKSKSEEKTEFKVVFECPQLKTELKTESIYDLAPPVFTFDALINNSGIMDYELSFNPPKTLPFVSEKKKSTFDLRTSHGNIFKDNNNEFRDPESGPFFIHVDVWYRVSPWIPSHNVERVSHMLNNYGGIALYRDFVNLFPADWGANYDWLTLSKRHIQKGSNLSYYNMYGYVEVFQESSLDLIDKTDRQGLLENNAFKELTLLIKNIIENFIENDFKERRDNFTNLRQNVARDPEVIEKIGTESSRLVDEILKKYNISKDPSDILSTYGETKIEKEQKLTGLKNSLSNLEKSVKQIRQIEESLVENAGFGLSAAIAIHELAKVTGNFYTGINQLIKADRLDKSKLEDLKDAASSLKSELKNLSPLRSIRNESVKPFSISRSIKYASEFYKRMFAKLNIQFKFQETEDFQLLERFGTVCQIFTNLIDNSCYWLDVDTKNKNKIIQVILNKEDRTIIFADNGPGIDNSIMPYLYQAGASLKSPPSGLGLYICQYYMNRMKGQIGLINERNRIKEMKGAQFILDFSRVPEE
ncbi:sensor histidine kinase [Leptospira santarosai]|uniref:sensor histidine kinase n=1 Tax=Leptospira santarosai TaxID=28183 RepID=UPI0002FA6536|nr:sensor histidine kinase [Leptospira santarosai]